MNQASGTAGKARRLALYLALMLALILLGLDRSAAWLHRPAADSTDIVIYTTTWCGYCTALRAHLDAHAIPYTDHDIESSLQGSMGFWSLRGRGVPVSVIGPDIVQGFDLERINTALAGLGHPVASTAPATAGGKR